MGEISLLLFGLLRQNVTFIRMFPLDFSCSGKGKPLFGTGISLHFWHFALFEFVNIISPFLRRPAKKCAKIMIIFGLCKPYFPKHENFIMQSRLHFPGNEKRSETRRAG